MGRAQPLLIALLVVASVGIVPGVAVADDDWPDRCENASIIEPGSYSGQLSPQDYDTFKVRISDGDYLSFRIGMSNPNARIQTLYHESQSEVSIPESSTGEDRVWVAEGLYTDDENDDGVVEFDLYAQETGVFCFPLMDSEDTVTNWSMSFSQGENEPPELVTGQEYKNISNSVAQKDQRISERESLLEQKNQTISELESRISELNSQSSNGSGGDITIQVTVNPANGQQNFVEGGEAVVQAENENADVSEMSVEYGSNTYQLNSSGEVAIPLAQTGSQEMTLVYGDTTKQVSFEVQGQEGQNQQNQQNKQDTTPTGTSGLGFGIVAVFIALLCSAFLLRRYRQS